MSRKHQPTLDTIYLYWGNKKLSFLRYLTVYSACKYNPKVTLILKRGDERGGKWGKAGTDNNPVEDYMPRLLNEKPTNLTIQYLEDFAPNIPLATDVYISDTLTWFLLANYGGTVADMDILFIDKVPDVTYDIGLIKYPLLQCGDVYPVGFLQGKPNDIFSAILDQALSNTDYSQHQVVGSDLLKRFIPNIDASALNVKWHPHELVYPFSDYLVSGSMIRAAIKRTFVLNCTLPNKCIGIHWYGGGAQEYNNIITEDNYRQHKCTISKYIERVLCQ